jgi:hypothetical protein
MARPKKNPNADDISISDAVDAAVEAVETVFSVAVEDIKDEIDDSIDFVVELSAATKAELAAGAEALKKYLVG